MTRRVPGADAAHRPGGGLKKAGSGRALWRYLPSEAAECGGLVRAILATCLHLRDETATPWYALPTLRFSIMRHQTQGLRLISIYDAAAAFGLYLDYREDWLRFAQRVAEHLPTRENAA